MLPLCRTASRQTAHAAPSTGATVLLPLMPLHACMRQLLRPTRGAVRSTVLLRQAASSTGGVGGLGSQPSPASSAGDAAAAADSPPPAEAVFYTLFEVADVDLHLQLLREAHYKHGVWLNVPPQLAPSGSHINPPPAVPEPMYPAKQQARLAAMAPPPVLPDAVRRGVAVIGAKSSMSVLAYAPTHDPPPFASTGTRALWVPEQSWTANEEATTELESSLPHHRPTTTGTAAAAATVEMQAVPIRTPPDADARFHCSLCGRGFRREEAAQQHVQERHAGERSTSDGDGTGALAAAAALVAGPQPGEAAHVVAGPGLGEITGYESRAVAAAAAATAPVTDSPAASRSPATTAARAHAVRDTTPPTTSPAPTMDLTSSTAATNTCTDGPAAAAAAATATPTSSPATDPTTATDADDVTDAAKRTRFASARAYSAPPKVALPEDELISEVLHDTWDDVALHRGDIEKPAGLDTRAAAAAAAATPRHNALQFDSCNGRYFIPSTCVVEGTADNRAELDAALAERPTPRATPEGVAPGIRRRSAAADPASLATIAAAAAAANAAVAARRLRVQQRGGDGTIGAGLGAGALLRAPTAVDMSIAELSRHYPNPFGDSPNAALMETEKEPVNPFIDLEAEAARRRDAATAAGAGADECDTSDGGASAPATPADPLPQPPALSVSVAETWLAQFTTRPYACPVCMRRALPSAAAALTSAASSAATPRPGGLASGEADAFASSYPTGSLVKVPTRADGDAPGTPTVASEARTLTADAEALEWYAARVPRFRLLDALQDHIAAAHGSVEGEETGEERSASGCGGDGGDADGDGDGSVGLDCVTDGEWRYLYSISQRPLQAAREELLAVQQAFRVLHPERSGAAAASRAEADGADNAPGSDLDAEAAAAAAAEAPPLHVRSAVNAVLVGTVRDVQEGFVGATRILQYVVAVCNPSNGHHRSASAAPDTAHGAEKAAGVEEEGGGETSEELVVVRCVGDLVPAALLRQQVRLGSTMFVSGSLRMNRNIDTVSRRSHAYPYVQVAPPLGCVRVLGV